MELVPVLALVLGNAAFIIPLFLWNRAESRADIRHMDQKLESNRELTREIHAESKEMRAESKELVASMREESKLMIEALREDFRNFQNAMMKETQEFHGKLFSLEERSKK